MAATHICSSCKERKDPVDFNKDTHAKSGHTSQCKSCIRKRQSTENRKAYVKKWIKENPERVAESKEKHQSLLRAKLREDRANNKPPSNREYYRLKKYGLTQKEYENLLLRQHHQCAICRAMSPGNSRWKGSVCDWHVDHNHETGKVRGLLCNKCNLALGLFRDNSTLLRIAAEYLDLNQN